MMLSQGVRGATAAVLSQLAPLIVLYPPSHTHNFVAAAVTSAKEPSKDYMQQVAVAQPTDPQAYAAQPGSRVGFSRNEILKIRSQIFGEPLRRGDRDGRKYLARRLRGPSLASWYFMPPSMPGSHNEEAE